MPDERIAASDLAAELGVHKATVLKVLRRLGIPHELRRDAERGGQQVATVTSAQADAVRLALRPSPAPLLGPGADSDDTVSTQLPDATGDFYLIQLEPDHDPGRFKVGFTVDLGDRLRKHRCSAPFAKYVRTWPCRRTWERAAIDSTTQSCQRLHTEVFRAPSLDGVLSRADAFFAVMPAPATISNAEEGQEPPGAV